MSDFDVTIDELPDPGYDEVPYEVNYTVVNNGSSTTDDDIRLYIGPMPETVDEDFTGSTSDYQGDTNSFSLNSFDNVLEGTTGGNTIGTLGKGVWEPGMNIRARFYVDDSSDDELAFLFGLQDIENISQTDGQYALEINTFDNEWGLADGTIGDGTPLITDSYDFYDNTVYEIVMVSYDNDPTDFDLTLYDITNGREIANIQGFDNTYSNHNTGGVGWYGWMSSDAYLDEAEEINELYDPPLKTLENIDLYVDGDSGSTEIDEGDTVPYEVTADYQSSSTTDISRYSDVGADSSGIRWNPTNHTIIADDEGNYTFTADYENESDFVDISVVPPIAWVDDFESYTLGTSDLMNTYSHGAVNDGEGNFEIVSNGLNGTSQSLSVSGGSSQTIEAHHDDGSNLDNYIDNGDTFRFAWEYDIFSSGNRAGVWYGLDYSGEPAGGVDYGAFYGGYVVWITSGNEQVRIREWTDFNATDIATVSISGYNTGETWECEVTWNGNSHNLSVYDDNGNLVGSDGASDSTHDADGTVGYGIDDGNNSGVYIDQVRII